MLIIATAGWGRFFPPPSQMVLEKLSLTPSMEGFLSWLDSQGFDPLDTVRELTESGLAVAGPVSVLSAFSELVLRPSGVSWRVLNTSADGLVFVAVILSSGEVEESESVAAFPSDVWAVYEACLAGRVSSVEEGVNQVASQLGVSEEGLTGSVAQFLSVVLRASFSV